MGLDTELRPLPYKISTYNVPIFTIRLAFIAVGFSFNVRSINEESLPLSLSFSSNEVSERDEESVMPALKLTDVGDIDHSYYGRN